MLHMERVRKLASFKEQAECMRQAVEMVEQGMAAMTLQARLHPFSIACSHGTDPMFHGGPMTETALSCSALDLEAGARVDAPSN